MILVVGATGFVGGLVTRRLLEEGQSVRALVRGGQHREEGRKLAQIGATVVEGDLTDHDSLTAACQGVKKVVCTATSMPHGKDDGLRRVDLEGTLALIDAAQVARIERCVFTSYSSNIQIDSPLETAKRTCERRLMAAKQMQTVILQPSYFLEAWLSPALGFDPAGGTVRVYGSGQNRVSYISAIDVAEFAVQLTVSEIDGTLALPMGGPRPVSQLEVVEVFAEKLEKKFALEYVSIHDLQEKHRSKDPLEKTFAALMLSYAQGDVIEDAVENARRFGVELTSLESYAESFIEP